MKYLDERITIQVDLGSPYPASGTYKYVIYEYDEMAQTEDDEIIFVGNMYYTRNNRYYTFDITDIVRSKRYNIDKNYILNNSTYNSVDSWLVNRYRIRVYLSDSSTKTSSWEKVAMIYRYPNVKKGLTDGSNVFEFSTGSTNILYPLIQGYKENKEVPLLSHYPLKDTRKYKFCQTFITSSDVTEFGLYYYNRYMNDDVSISTAQVGSTTTCIIPINVLIDFQHYQQELDEDVKVEKCIDGEYDKKIAVLDYCYKRYYLLWQDRYGGYQSQAFNNDSTFTEEFDVTETQNYKNERTKSFIQVQPKWSINSGWISEDVYPYYESIYVSPLLVLYDAYEDAVYEVMVNSSYKEKTYKNEKKMINLSLELEAVSKQNIIY